MRPAPTGGTEAPAERPAAPAAPPPDPPAWKAARTAAKLPPPPAPKPAPGGLAFHGSAGAGHATSTPVPDAKAVAPTATAPHDPSTQINRLKSDGDTATFSVTAGAGFAVATPWTGPVNVGPQASAGYTATVAQVGGGGPGRPATAAPPKFSVTLEKNQAAGVYGTVNASDAIGHDGVAWLELNGRHADRVTMTFNSKDDAARAVRLTQQEAEAQTLRDASTVVQPGITVPDPRPAAEEFAKGMVHDPVGTIERTLNPANLVKDGGTVARTVAEGAVHDVESLFNNPLAGNNSAGPLPGTVKIPLPLNNTLAPAGPVLDKVAAAVEPSAADKAFMQDHVTGYETALTGQERLTVEARLGLPASIDGRGALNGTLTRTVTLPTPAADGVPAKPGTVSYEGRANVTVDTRNRLKIGALLEKALGRGGVSLPEVGTGRLGLGGGVNTITPLGEMNASSRLTFAMTPEQSAAVKGARGDPSSIPGMVELGKPTAADVTLQGRVQVPPPATGLAGDAAFYGNYKLHGSLADPGDTLGQAGHQVLDGNPADALDTLARHTTLDGEVSLTRQDGGNVNAIPAAHVKDGPLQLGEAWGLLSLQAQTDTVVARASGQVAWQDAPAPPAAAAPPQEPPEAPPPHEPPREPPRPQPYQVAVVPHEGLNIHAAPDMDAKVVAPTYSGTFLQATGRTRTDAQGDKWLEVSGPDVNRRERKGWVAERYVERHPEGAMAPGAGRIDRLRQDGYVPVRVQPGDTISGIALKNGADPKKAVAVNGGHVIDTDLIFPGDTVYIRKQ